MHNMSFSELFTELDYEIDAVEHYFANNTHTYKKAHKDFLTYKSNLVIFENIKTFSELCDYGVKIVTNEAIFTPTYAPMEDILYEMHNDKYWIRNIMKQLNENGLLTNMSQPGDDRSWANNKDKFNKTHQRAFVSGHMMSDNAARLFAKLKDDPKLVIKVDSLTSDNNPEYGYMTVEYSSDDRSIFNPVTFNNTPCSYDEMYGMCSRCVYPKISDLSGVHIMAKDFNDNTHLWTTVLEHLRSI